MAEYIKREDALKFQDELEPCFCRSAITGEAFIATKDADLVPFLQNIPAEDVRPVVRGKWRKAYNPSFSPFDDSGAYIFFCSVCGKSYGHAYRFCPSCGADTRGGVGNE